MSNLNISNPQDLKDRINTVVEIIKSNPTISEKEVMQITGFAACSMRQIWNLARRRALK